MVSRITPKLRVGGLFLALLLAAPAAIAAQGEPLLLTATRTELTGAFSFDGPADAIWFRPDGRDAPGLRLTAFELAAADLRVTNLTYAGGASTTLAGQTLTENEPRAVTETSRVVHATVTVLSVHADAEVRILPLERQDATLNIQGTHTLFADAAQAPEFTATTTVHTDTENLARFFQVPDASALMAGTGADVITTGDVAIWVRGVDLRVTAGGQSTEFRTRSSTAATPAGAGTLEAETSTWTDFVLEASAETNLAAGWNGHVDIFTVHGDVTGKGTARFVNATGTIPGLDGALQVIDGDHEQTGALQATIDRAAGAGDARIAWTFPAPPVAPAAAPAATTHMPTWAPLLVVLLLGAALGAGPPIVLWTARRHRSQGPPAPEPAAGPPPPAQAPAAQAMRLVNDGRHDEALPVLERAVRARPKDPEVRYALGVALGRNGRIREAVKHLEYAVRRQPAALGLLVSDAATESFRHHPMIAQLVRRAARRFREEDAAGYV